MRAWPYFERVGLTTGAVSVVMIAALVSGLTQANCYLVVKTYGYAIGGFGLSGLIAAVALVIGMCGVPGRIVGAICTALAIPMFLGAGLAGLDNLRRSSSACFFFAPQDQQKVNLIEFPLEIFISSPKLWQ